MRIEAVGGEIWSTAEYGQITLDVEEGRISGFLE